MTAEFGLERRRDGYYLRCRRLARTDVIEVKLPMVGWCRGRFSVLASTVEGSLPVATLVSNRQVIALDPSLVDAVRWPDDTPSFTCPTCKRTSYNLNDVRDSYCGACHQTFA